MWEQAGGEGRLVCGTVLAVSGLHVIQRADERGVRTSERGREYGPDFGVQLPREAPRKQESPKRCASAVLAGQKRGGNSFLVLVRFRVRIRVRVRVRVRP